MHPRDQLYASLAELEARACAARRSAGRKSGRDVAAAQALHRWRALAPDAVELKFSGANIRSWLHPDADRRSVPKDFGKLWALVCVWSEWSGEQPAAVVGQRPRWESVWRLAREADSPATPARLRPWAVARVAFTVLAGVVVILGATRAVRQPAEADPTPASATVAGTCYGGAEQVAIRDGRSGTAMASARCADVNLQIAERSGSLTVRVCFQRTLACQDTWTVVPDDGHFHVVARDVRDGATFWFEERSGAIRQARQAS